MASNVSSLLEKITPELAETLHLESGQCHTFAVELGQASGLPYNIVIITRQHYVDDELEFDCFSHATVEIDGGEYDFGGDDASGRWEDQWDPENYHDEDGGYSEFKYITVENSPSIEEVRKVIAENDYTSEEPLVETIDGLRALFGQQPTKKMKL